MEVVWGTVPEAHGPCEHGAAGMRGLGCMAIREQTAEFLLARGVALAGASLKAGALKHRNVTAAVVNDACALQLPGSLRDAFAADSQGMGNQFLRHDQFVRG